MSKKKKVTKLKNLLKTKEGRRELGEEMARPLLELLKPYPNPKDFWRKKNG